MVTAFSALMGIEAPTPTDSLSTTVHLGFWVGRTPDSMPAIEAWLHRPALWADASRMYAQVTSWDDIYHAPWLGPEWARWLEANPERRLVTTVPLLPAGDATLALGATGAYDGHYAALARTLIERRLATAILRLGSEFNAGGPGRVASRADAELFVHLWQHAVTAMRGVPGAERLAFVWSGTNEKTGYELEAAYPGDATVDYVGAVIMDRSLEPSAYPYPIGASDSVRLECQKQAWDLSEFPASANGLAAWIALAKAHGKPFCLTQWGLYADHHNQCGYDNPYYIRRMHEVIADPANHVAFAIYFNYYHCSKISPTGADGTNYPASSALFHDAFALPAP
jgi:hypothetical protein